jgi:hypothetical protein
MSEFQLGLSPDISDLIKKKKAEEMLGQMSPVNTEMAFNPSTDMDSLRTKTMAQDLTTDAAATEGAAGSAAMSTPATLAILGGMKVLEAQQEAHNAELRGMNESEVERRRNQALAYQNLQNIAKGYGNL